ncbi:twin-arginine translocase subunit TatC [Porphyromonadaceae sp. NP-X]|jgi:sec-independent protein translocase protein TatC|nr:twin-arginine translocase subunit TatC [Paludibacteraceae bacterium]MBP9017449.1 twin-arginine translocase subunit TatC [Paludibacteraceae bacterium]MDS1031874.1 twin-arginine translocase subunit TatC [Porphyromonadaceae sp. NP-X]NLJ19786.1 twin-arginine translocase subunit TatC [Bacteroidales bacterium]
MSLNNKASEQEATFWWHLEKLRWVILRTLAVVGLLMVIFFSNKNFLFNKIILAPLNSDFYVYRWFNDIAKLLNFNDLTIDNFHVQLININLAGQFMAHLSISFAFALIVSVPYLLFEIWRFIFPALYPHERKNIELIFFFSSFLFYLGAIVSYLIIFPLTIRFLGTYQVSSLVPNQIALSSYISALYILVFSMGLTFEMPVLSYFLSRLGIISRQTLKKGRGIALIVILIAAAVITPTTDPFTMMVVAIPLYLLYEVSILVCKKDTAHEKTVSDTN